MRAVLMLMAVAEPPSSSRVTSAARVALSSAMNRTGLCATSQRRPSTSSAGQSSSAKVSPRSAISRRARTASEAVQPRLPSMYRSTSGPSASRSARQAVTSSVYGCRPTFTLKVVMPYVSRIRSASATISAAGAKPTMWLTRMRSE